MFFESVTKRAPCLSHVYYATVCTVKSVNIVFVILVSLIFFHIVQCVTNNAVSSEFCFVICIFEVLTDVFYLFSNVGKAAIFTSPFLFSTYDFFLSF